MTCILAVVAWIWLPPGPEKAWFLTADEREFVKERVQPGNTKATTPRSSAAGWRKAIMETVKDWKMWFVLLCNICASVPATAFSVFLPLIVEGMGYKSIEANLVSY